MNKKIISLMFATVAVFALSGCDGADDAYEDGYEDGYHDGSRVPESGMTTLFLIDRKGFSASDVEYTCINSFGDVSGPFYTEGNGEFTFEPGENCTFELIGFDGTPGDELFIESDIGQPKDSIPYSCYGGDAGLTDLYGSFNYLINDSCTFAF